MGPCCIGFSVSKILHVNLTLLGVSKYICYNGILRYTKVNKQLNLAKVENDYQQVDIKITQCWWPNW